MRRLIIIVAVMATLIGTLAWFAYREVPVSVELTALARAPMEVTVDVDGKTRIREVYEVSAPIAGTALRAPVRVGDTVIAGETVVAIVRPIAPTLLDARSRSQAEAAVHEAEAALQVAESQVAQAREDMTYSEQQFQRAKALVERGVASLTRLEEADQLHKLKNAAYNTAVSNRDMTASALERARAALIEPDSEQADGATCCVELRAPVSGRVLSVDAVSERPVAVGARLVTLGAPGDLEIIASPLSRDAVLIPNQAKAYVERWGGAMLEARLRRIDPSAHAEVSTLGIEEQRVEALFDVVSPLELQTGLGDGYAVYLRVVIWEAADVLQVPVGALFRTGQDWAVFRAVADRAVLTHVTIGHRNTTSAEVLSGLSPGDQVISHPSDKVADGVLLTPLAFE